MATRRKPMSNQTKAHLLDADVMSTRGLTLTAKARACPTCRAQCWAGLADIGPYDGVWVNYAPTTTFGELLALSVRIPTYMLDGHTLERRTRIQIADYPADRFRTHVRHQCNGPPLPVHPEWNKHHSKQSLPMNDIPPF